MAAMAARLLLVLTMAAAAFAGRVGEGNAPASQNWRRGKIRAALLERIPSIPPLAFQVTPLYFEANNTENRAATTPHLLQFKGRGDDYCAMMEPLKDRLFEEHGVRIRCFEVWQDTKNLELLRIFDNGRCGGVPFFYNKRTKRWICGATTYDNLRKWALDEMCDPFLAPRELIEKQQNEQGEMQKNIQQFVQKIKATAREKMGLSVDDDEDD